MTNSKTIDDQVAAAAFRRLLFHLQHRSDAQNVDLMGLAGFCRNCLADWVMEASEELGRPLSKEDSRHAVYGMPYEVWKRDHQAPASAEQIARMDASVAKNKAYRGADDES